MKNEVNRRARHSGRARPRKLLVRLARSWLVEISARSFVTAILLFGLVLITWGMIATVGRVGTGLTALADYAGGGQAVLSSTAKMMQHQVLGLLGLGSLEASQDSPEDAPDNTSQGQALVPPDRASAQATLSVLQTAVARVTPGAYDAPPGEGFVPYQVEVGGPDEKAPALGPTPTPFMPVTGGVSTPEPTGTPNPTPTATPAVPSNPDWIVIPSIDLDAPIVTSHKDMVRVKGKMYMQWQAPNFYAAGWQEGSAPLGVPGNTVLNGHHNIDGMVFGRLYELQRGDKIIVYSNDHPFYFVVSQVMKLEERYAPIEQRLQNASWIMPSGDTRLTLVTCWPPSNNTYRIIVVAVPGGN